MLPVLAGLSLIATACGGAASGTATSAPQPSQAAASSPVAAAASSPSASGSASPSASPATIAVGVAPTSTTSGASAVATKANANTGSAGEIQSALEAAGVPNAARWVREVQEYRPYPSDDPSIAKLRQELIKYNPGQDVIDKIISALTV